MRKKNPVDNLDLPAHYDHTKLTLIAKDPYWIFAYWEIAPSTLKKLKKKIGIKLFNKSSYMIRMYDVTSVDFNGKNANSSFDVNITSHKGNLYISLPCDNANYCAELGIAAPDGDFSPLAMSNCTAVPRQNSSPRSDVILMDPKNEKGQSFTALKEKEINKFAKVNFEDLSRKAKRSFLTEDDVRAYYSKIIPLKNGKAKQPAPASKKDLAVKHNKSQKNNYKENDKKENNKKENGKDANDIIFHEIFKNNFLGSSEYAGSSELKGGASEQEKNEREFSFEIGTELIVYGRTEPDAEVMMNGEKINIKKDGTFSMRFALPDGKIPLDLIAISNNKVDKRIITTSVERTKTKTD